MLHSFRALRAGPSLFEVYRNRPHARANTLKWELAALPALSEWAEGRITGQACRSDGLIFRDVFRAKALKIWEYCPTSPARAITAVQKHRITVHWSVLCCGLALSPSFVLTQLCCVDRGTEVAMASNLFARSLPRGCPWACWETSGKQLAYTQVRSAQASHAL
jgi:hypothetical protein